MSKADMFGAVAIVVCTFVFAWVIVRAVRAGKWRYRGGIAYRETRPKLFWGIVTCAAIMEVFLIIICLVMLNHIVFCAALGTPRACLARSLNMLIR
jgi:hypothetical protein